MTNTNPTPIRPVDPTRGLAPHAYVVQKTTQICVCCSTTHHSSTIYAKTHIKSNLGLGKSITNLRPLPHPTSLYNLPIELIFLPHTTIPFCHECASHASLAHYPSARIDPSTARTPINSTPQPITKPNLHQSPLRRKAPTMDDLI